MAAAASADEKHPLGYKDTPLIPGTKWHVHDSDRPQPPVITPGAKCGDAPSDAVVLFNGKDLEQWTSGKRDGSAMEPAKWVVREGFFECVPKSGYLFTKESFGPDVQLHVEFATPNPPEGESQGRGNSGVFFYGGTYEIQVLSRTVRSTAAPRTARSSSTRSIRRRASSRCRIMAIRSAIAMSGSAS
jgi:hypothetical protein